MTEYRRFIAYFYEYIDGKKQKNAGFAKVELRNGMWRVLFRLTVPVSPEPPVHVLGFVRDGENLREFMLGTVNHECRSPEEWAWRADAPVGLGKYYFEQMTGIRIQSGEGRVFITVWDDEAVAPERFVAELPDHEASSLKPESEHLDLPERAQEEHGGERSEHPKITQKREENEPEQPEQKPEEMPKRQEQEHPEQKPEEIPMAPIESPDRIPTELPERQPVGNPVLPVSSGISEPVSVRPRQIREAAVSVHGIRPNPAEVLLRGRQRFQPFQDDEFADCVQIKLCDILPLQQENWQVGRSNFLQHGYYLYRHLLLGRAKDGGYILGVPGVQNQQEEYMARTFGFDRFKTSGLCGRGRRFGYWYRVLREPEKTLQVTP